MTTFDFGGKNSRVEVKTPKFGSWKEQMTKTEDSQIDRPAAGKGLEQNRRVTIPLKRTVRGTDEKQEVW